MKSNVKRIIKPKDFLKMKKKQKTTGQSENEQITAHQSGSEKKKDDEKKHEIVDPYEYEFYADFGQGDKFYLKDFEIDKGNKKIIFKGSQGQMNWIRMDVLHPVVLSSQKCGGKE